MGGGGQTRKRTQDADRVTRSHPFQQFSEGQQGSPRAVHCEGEKKDDCLGFSEREQAYSENRLRALNMP